MKSQARLRLRKPYPKIAVSNSPLITLVYWENCFRCPCGANVFMATGVNVYRCNGCGESFVCSDGLVKTMRR